MGKRADQPKTYYYESTGEAYDDSQCNEAINDGDILVCKEERVVGFLYKAWPVAVTVDVGAFHFTNDGTRAADLDTGSYYTSAVLAEKLALELGFEVRQGGNDD